MKIYFAGPWFTAAQEEREERLKTKLRSLGFEVHSPKEESNITGSFADSAVRKATFDSNIENIDKCDILFAVCDGKQGICTEPDKNGQPFAGIDAGTMIESGYAYNSRKRTGSPIIVYYSETLGDKPFNLMLAQSADIVITDYDELDNLPKWIAENTKIDYNGKIE